MSNFKKKIIDEFELSNKVSAIVSDNALNITAAIRNGGWKGIGCFTYSLNLIVQAAIKEVSDIIAKVKKIVELFHRSSQGLKRLQETQKQMNLPELKLKQDVITRWNSSYEMLQRIVDIQDAVTATLALIRPDLSLDLEDWQIIKEIIPILKPFYEVTVEMSAEKNVTLSKVTVLCNLLEAFIARSNSFNDKVKKMLTTLQRELLSRFANLERNYLYAESTLLDPRLKKKDLKAMSHMTMHYKR